MSDVRKRVRRCRGKSWRIGLTLGALLAAFVAGSQRAGASGFAITAQSGSGAGNAFANAAAAEDSSVVWYNPAGMSDLEQSDTSLALHVIKPSFRFHDKGSTGVFALPGAGNGGDGGDVAVVPQTYAALALSDRWRVGLAVNSPFGLQTQYPSGWQGQLLALKSEVRSYNVNPALAYRFNRFLSIGAGVDWQRFTAELTNFAGPAGFADLNAADHSWGGNAGLMLDLPDGARAGLSYRSGFTYRLRGSAVFTAGAGALNSGVRADLKVPENVALHLFAPLGAGWDLVADATWTRWNCLHQLTVTRTTASASGGPGSPLTSLPFDWKDSVYVGLGADLHVSESLELRFGVGHDPSVSNSAERTPRLPDESRTSLTLGVRAQLWSRGTLDLAYIHDFVNNASVDNSIAGAPGSLMGDFHVTANALSLQYNQEL